MRGRAKRRRVVGVAAVSAAAALVAWITLHGGSEGRPAGPVSPPWDRLVEALSTPAAPDREVDSRAGPSLDDHGPEERQVCGGQWVKVGADGEIGAEPPGMAEAAALRERVAVRLRADRDEYARAVGAWIDAPDDAALVRLALGARDPRVYALAFMSCRRIEPQSACNLLSAAQWARLDPGNAAPWLFELDAANARNDAAAVDAALFQIGRAERSAFDLFSPLAPALDAAPAGDADALATLNLAVQLVGQIAALPLPGFQTLINACRQPAIADANRRQACEQVGDVLAHRSDELLTQLIGSRVAENVGRSVEGLAVRRFEWQLYGAALVEVDGAVDPLGCKSVYKLIDRLGEQARFGETGAIRRWVDRSGLTEAQILEKGQAMALATAAAASAMARAASAASSP